MRELASLFAASAPEAVDALRVIAYFDQLTQRGANLRSIARGAAALTMCPAVFVDRASSLGIRVLPDGTATELVEEKHPDWVGAASGDGSLRVWIERERGDNDTLDALVAERALLAVCLVLGHPLEMTPRDEAGWVSLLVDDDASLSSKDTALTHLGLTRHSPIHVVATAGNPPAVVRAADLARVIDRTSTTTERTGVGPEVLAENAADSWEEARLALRLTAEGTPRDPGDRVVYADEVGALLTLAESVRPDRPAPRDVVTLDSAAESVPWLLETVHAVTSTQSLREASALLHVHHSTVQERIRRAELALGWSISSQQGKVRAQIALAVRRARSITTRTLSSDEPKDS